MDKTQRRLRRARAKTVTSSCELADKTETTIPRDQLYSTSHGGRGGQSGGRGQKTGPPAPAKAGPFPKHPKETGLKQAARPGRRASPSSKAGTVSKRNLSGGGRAVPPPAASDTVKWRRHGASAQEIAQLKGEAAGRTFRVRTVKERPDGAGMVTTYSVPGEQLAVWLSELLGRRDDQAETILSIWSV